MQSILFIGLGNMGLPMALNLQKAGYHILGQEIDPKNSAKATESGIELCQNIAKTLSHTDIIITMLPSGQFVKDVLQKAIFPFVKSGALIIDCSTIDVETSRELAKEAKTLKLDIVDAPVSGGVAGATAASLTLMVGGSQKAFDRAEPILKHVGKKIIHCGDAGAGQGVKICNNMMLGIQMISVCEGFTLAHKLGLDPAKLYEVSAAASGQCWSLTSYCPEPGLVSTAPSNRQFTPGFTTAMMLKDLKLSQESAIACHASTPLGKHAKDLYQDFLDQGNGNLDFSAIIQYLKDQSS